MKTMNVILAGLMLMPGLIRASEPEPSHMPRAVAATRSELKRQLEDSKRSQPRLPLPAPAAEEIAEAASRAGAGAPGLHGIINNGRMRKLYLPPEFVSGGFSRDRTPDPVMSLSSAFKTEFFWIVSRINNCTYCQGHQEVKLTAEGLSEETIAALDGSWDRFTPAERAAFAFTRKLTRTPHAIADADIDALRPYYKDAQILEIILTVAGNNAMNRWTGALAIPQEENRDFLTPVAEQYRTATSLVAPIDASSNVQGQPACAMPAQRGKSPSSAEIEAAIEASRTRKPRLSLVDESKALAMLPSDRPAGETPQWVRLLLTFPKAGLSRVALHEATEKKGRLDRVLSARIAWVAAREDRAWYALGQARRRLRELGGDDAELAHFDEPGTALPKRDVQALGFARKLTVDPALITDADVANLRRQFSDQEVAEIVFQVTEAAFFDRLTEAAGLAPE